MVILASASPRRREILESLGVDVKIVTADIDESTDKSFYIDAAMDIARKKCEATANKLEKEFPNIEFNVYQIQNIRSLEESAMIVNATPIGMKGFMADQMPLMMIIPFNTYQSYFNENFVSIFDYFEDYILIFDEFAELNAKLVQISENVKENCFDTYNINIDYMFQKEISDKTLNLYLNEGYENTILKYYNSIKINEIKRI